ncbi:hypothetical protein IWQ62_002281 [Dispira parvispora]|uniref:Molybdopterin synthase sulfur carrier subunit n=1 Tax=Dispira parvispora TaxID=1520584 RepID=A0A9W8ARN4_9FUNG|nr:hypothetical protein IWQ62_002281 [Dispira parvispora]
MHQKVQRPAMQCKVCYFAAAREAVDLRDSEVYEVENSTTLGELLDQCTRRYPALKGVLGQCLLAVNHEYLPTDVPWKEVRLQNNDEVAIIPPVSGG